MAGQNILYYVRILVIAVELFVIIILSYAARIYLPIEMGRYISFDVFYCLPVVQAAGLGSIHALRRSDSQAPTVIAIIVAVTWSIVETTFAWPYPINAFALNVFTRSVTFTVIARVVAKLWQEREHGRKDVLTSLSNRLEFFERFEIEQLRSERSGKPYSLFYIDIDQFKMVNDNHGHHVGDKALKMLSDILRKNSRRTDTISRFGGDEFVLLVPDTDGLSCEILADRIKQDAEKAFQNQGWSISLSIGHVTEIGKKRSADEILREADGKMYSAKREK